MRWRRRRAISTATCRRLERDVEGVAPGERPGQRAPDGRGVGARQATELQHELETLARRQTVLEDEQSEAMMEQREAVGVDVEHSRGVLAAAEQAVGEIVERRDTALADIDAAEAGRRRDRQAIAVNLPADLLVVYDKRRERQGTGAAALLQRRCQACRLELDRTAVAALRAAPPDEVVYCEECGVILVRTPESGL